MKLPRLDVSVEDEVACSLEEEACWLAAASSSVAELCRSLMVPPIRPEMRRVVRKATPSARQSDSAITASIQVWLRDSTVRASWMNCEAFLSAKRVSCFMLASSLATCSAPLPFVMAAAWL